MFRRPEREMPKAGDGPAATMRFELGGPDSAGCGQSQGGGEYFTAAVAPDRCGTVPRPDHYCTPSGQHGGEVMRSILLWAIGVPIPIILLLALCTHHF
jgi:hypothetical protein